MQYEVTLSYEVFAIANMKYKTNSYEFILYENFVF